MRKNRTTCDAIAMMLVKTGGQAVVGGLQRMVEELNEELPFSMRFEIEIKEHAEEFRNQKVEGMVQ
jgi:nicotinate-nucleotide pyrophosphorylase